MVAHLEAQRARALAGHEAVEQRLVRVRVRLGVRLRRDFLSRLLPVKALTLTQALTLTLTLALTLTLTRPRGTQSPSTTRATTGACS